MKERLKGLTRVVSIFLLGVGLIAVYKTFDNISVIFAFIGRIFGILSPFVVGLGLAFLLYAPANWLETRLMRIRPRWISRHARAISVLLVYLMLILLLSLLLTFVLPAIIRGAVNFATSLPGYYDQFMSFLNSLTEDGSILQGLDITKTVDKLYSSYIEPQLTADAVLSYFKGLMDFTTSLLSLLMAFIISIYMLLTRESLLRAGKLIFGLFLPDRLMTGLAYYTHRSCDILYSYFFSQMLDALIVGIIMTIGLGIFRAPSAPMLGFLVGLFNLIPYFGAIIGGSIAVVITLLSGNFYGAIFVAIYIVAMQQVDASLIQPRIVGNTVGIRPIYVLFAITLFGGLFGFWGIFFGVPAIAIIQMLLRDYISYRHQLSRIPIQPTERNP